MSRVLVAEKVDSAGLDILRKAGHEVVELVGAPRERLLAELATRTRSSSERDESRSGAARSGPA
jgi:hypothetical protein